MQYMLLINSSETYYEDISPERMGEIMAGYASFTEEVQKAGILRGGERLRSVTTATTVRVREGKTLTTDGPFAETKEQLGGFYTLECADLDEAIKWAAKIPTSEYGSIEVRPVWEEEG